MSLDLNRKIMKEMKGNSLISLRALKEFYTFFNSEPQSSQIT